eukprot:COSAG01_NODE_2755_length_7137_cov_3.530548_4_plen_76_part_00
MRALVCTPCMRTSHHLTQWRRGSLDSRVGARHVALGALTLSTGAGDRSKARKRSEGHASSPQQEQTQQAALAGRV